MRSDAPGELKLTMFPAHRAPFPDKNTFHREDLDTAIVAVGDINEVFGGMHSQASRVVELTVLLTIDTPFVEKGAIEAKDLDTVIEAVNNENPMACGVNCYS